MIKNKLKLFLIIVLCSLTFSGCNKDKPFILCSSYPISKQSPAQRIFKTGQKINFIIITPEEFKHNVLRIQIIKMNKKTKMYGYKMAHGRDVEIDISKKYHIDSVYLHQEGWYMMRIFSHDNLNKPIAQTDFIVEAL